MKNRKIKILLCMILVLATCLSLSACGKKEEQISRVEDLAKKNIAVEFGSSNAFDIAAMGEELNANVMLAPTASDAFAYLIHGKADAYAVDNIQAKTLMQQVTGFVVLPEEIPQAGYGIAVQKGDKLLEKINACIADFKERGVLDSLEEKWINSDSYEAKSVSQIWAGREGTISCRVATMEPFAFYNADEELVGYDIDLVLMIAKALDVRVEFSEGDISDIFPSLGAGQIDMIAGGLTITDERLQKVDFSDPYYKATTVFMVKDLSVVQEQASFFDRVHKVFFEEGRDVQIVNAMLTSLKIIIISFFLGLAYGTLLFLLRYSGNKVIIFIFDKFKYALGLSPLVGWIFVVYYLFFAGNSVNNFTAGVVAFSVIFGNGVYGSYVGSVGAIDEGQVEAATSMGYSKYKALFKVFLPQAMPGFMAGLSGEVIGLAKISSLIEFIGVGDVQTITDAFRASTFEAFIPIIFCCLFYIAVAFILSKIMAYLGKVFDRHNRSEEVVKKNVLRGRI